MLSNPILVVQLWALSAQLQLLLPLAPPQCLQSPHGPAQHLQRLSPLFQPTFHRQLPAAASQQQRQQPVSVLVRRVHGLPIGHLALGLVILTLRLLILLPSAIPPFQCGTTYVCIAEFDIVMSTQSQSASSSRWLIAQQLSLSRPHHSARPVEAVDSTVAATSVSHC